MWWMLRTPGEDSLNAVTVEFEGEIFAEGPYSTGRSQSWPLGVRPAITISLK